MKLKNATFFAGLLLVMTGSACNSNRTNTEADREATYTQDGDTINPTEGNSEGTTGQQFMETNSPDSTEEIEQ